MIITNIETDALSFMAKRKGVEDKRKKEMLKTNEKLYKEILAKLKSAGDISISYIPSYVLNELKPIVDKYRNEQQTYIDSFIRDDFEVGISTGYKFLSLTKENISPKNNEIRDSEYEEILLALLLYGQRIIDSQYDDLNSNLVKDMTSIYINNRQNNIYSSEKEIDTDNDSTLNTILAGSIISKYINPTFKNINNRTNMTAQNETNRSLNHGLLMTYLITKRDYLSDMAVKWVEVQDERLCKYCRDAASGGDFGHGVYNIVDVTPPPLHSRCRCILVPYLLRWNEVI